MKNYKDNTYLVITHVQYYENGEGIQGPYTSVTKALERLTGNKPFNIKVPLVGYKNPIYFGKEGNLDKISIPSYLGKFAPIKYFIDLLMTFLLIGKFALQSTHEKKVIISIDPLSTMPAVVLQYLFNYMLIR